ncbi:hypothetical protein FACS1894204_11500 [Synergistales bacterium]|nr:hypothetical protein FACS1894204_11500 [Synergistales bacterium]
MPYINSSIFLGLAVWIFGFALMLSGWLVDVLFEGYGLIPSKILYKTGACIVAVPVIYLLWKTSGLLYSYRFDMALLLRTVMDSIETLAKSI